MRKHTLVGTGDQVAWVLELSVAPKHRRAFLALVTKLTASARAEPGTLTYEWYLSSDGTICHLYERYANDEAACHHAARFAKAFASRLFAVAKPTRVVVYGTPSPKTRRTFGGLGPLFLAPIAGLRR